MQHLSIPQFDFQLSSGQHGTCDVDVYLTPDRHQVVVYLQENRDTLAQEPHRVINKLYREELFRHLTPASRLTFYHVNARQDCCPIELGGLPGGYTSGQVETYRQVLPELQQVPQTQPNLRLKAQ